MHLHIEFRTAPTISKHKRIQYASPVQYEMLIVLMQSLLFILFIFISKEIVNKAAIIARAAPGRYAIM